MKLRPINFFREPTLKILDYDDTSRFKLHREILKNKKILRQVFTEFHNSFWSLDQAYFSGSGDKIELGAGVFPMKESFPDVLSSDIVEAQSLDLVLNAEDLELKDNSVRSLFCQNCFHHLSDPRKFFREASRVLTVGGGVIILEPFYGQLASVLYKHMFAQETFDKDQLAWSSSSKGPMNEANQALSFIVFKRDREVFLQEFPKFEIVYEKIYSNYLRYLLSGGLNFRQFVPDFCLPAVRALEVVLSPFNHVLGLHHVIVIRKIKD